MKNIDSRWSRFQNICLIALILLLSSCAETTREPLKLPVFLTIGDSIGNGYGLAKPWPEIVSEKLGVSVSNHSKSGEQTNWGLNALSPLLKKHRPDYVLIMLGTNDISKGAILEESLNNLQSMVDLAKQAGAKVYVATVLPIPNKKYQKINDRGTTLSSLIKTELDAAIVVDVRKTFNPPHELLADGLHPNQKGQNIIAETFIEAVNKQM